MKINSVYGVTQFAWQALGRHSHQGVLFPGDEACILHRNNVVTI